MIFSYFVKKIKKMSLMERAKNLIKRYIFKEPDNAPSLEEKNIIEAKANDEKEIKISKNTFNNILLKTAIRAIGNFDLKAVKMIIEQAELDVQFSNNKLICTAITISALLPTQRKELDQESKASIKIIKEIIKYLLDQGARPDLVKNEEFIDLFEWPACWHHALLFYLTSEGDGQFIEWLHQNTTLDFSQVYPECITSAYMEDHMAIFVYLLNRDYKWTDKQSHKYAINIIDKIYKNDQRWIIQKLLDKGMIFYFDISFLGEDWFEKLSKDNLVLATSVKSYLGNKKEFNTRDDYQLFKFVQYINELDIRKNGQSDEIKPVIEFKKIDGVDEDSVEDKN